jgi:hypothetical protein
LVESGAPDEEDEEEEEGEGEFELVYAAPEAVGGEHGEVRSFARRFKIVNEEGAILFRRQLKEATVITRGVVKLGGVVDDFEIGPAVDIRCGKLEIHSTGLVVRGGATSSGEFDAVVMDAVTCESQVLRKPRVRGALSVFWPGAQDYPWNEFAGISADDGTDSGKMHEVRRRFHRIVMTLRSHSKGSLARFKDKVEHRRVLRNEVGRALLAQLLDDGIMELKKDFYHWVPERAGVILKVSWHDLRHRRVTPELNTYLVEFIANNENLF